MDDVIVLITDGLPTRSRKQTMNDTLSLASSLRGKGVRFVGIAYSYAYSYSKRMTNFVTDISTYGKALETKLQDITMTVDRVVDAICPIPLTGIIFTCIVCADDRLFSAEQNSHLK